MFIIARKKSATKQEFISKIKMFCPKCKQETNVIIDEFLKSSSFQEDELIKI